MVEFVSMTRREAKAFLAQFCAEMPARLDALRRDCAATGGPASETLDLSPSSLDPVFVWAAPRFAWRDGYQPPQPGEMGGGRRFTPDELEAADELPSWFDPWIPGWASYSAETLWLIDGLARYFGECLTHNVPGASWTTGHSRRKGYVYQNHPVVTGLPTDDCEPMWVVANIVLRVLMGTAEATTAMSELYAVWTQPRPR